MDRPVADPPVWHEYGARHQLAGRLIPLEHPESSLDRLAAQWAKNIPVIITSKDVEGKDYPFDVERDLIGGSHLPCCSQTATRKPARIIFGR